MADDSDSTPGSRGARFGAGRLLVLAALLAGGALLAAGLYWLIRHDALVALAQANTWLADRFIARLGYGGVFLLMLIESSFVPFPSEIVIPPAADLARRLPDWSLGGVIAAGVGGSLAGAWINYGLARYLGRSIVVGLVKRYGRYVHLSPEAYARGETFFLRHGAIATFTGRLIPGIRQIVSLPAGLARMNLMLFSLLTALGASIWVVVLAVVGYRFGQDAAMLSGVLKEYSLVLVIGAGVLVTGYILWARLAPGRGVDAPE